MNNSETDECRYCKLILIGKPYYLGGVCAYFREYSNNKRYEAKINWYGGFVCSRTCDEKACLAMQSSFPGVGLATIIDSNARRHIESNWADDDRYKV